MFELEAISPIDGRYRKKVSELSPYFSESALFKYRIIVEGEYLISLSEVKDVTCRKIKADERGLIRSLYNLSEKDGAQIKEIERTTNHDVKAVEYFMKEKLKKSSLKDCLEWIHFCLTSEDTNNLAYGLMLDLAIKQVVTPEIDKLIGAIENIAAKYRQAPMLARTHGQSASPTTVGKEFKNFSTRLKKQLDQLKKYKISVKLNGATGNYNAHQIAFPSVNWPKFSTDFVKSLNVRFGSNLETNLVTAQIESHDTYAEVFDILSRINVILIDFNQDIWRYISDGWIKQKPKEGEIGSSTMPHKINPIDFENSEGNLGLANALFSFFSQKLPVSRLQRDLSDSTVERNFGVALAYSLIAYKSTLKGLSKIEINEEKILADLNSHPEILAEPLQIILKKEGFESAYEKMKDLTRGKDITRQQINEFIDSLKISDKLKSELKKISPENYTGLAKKLG